MALSRIAAQTASALLLMGSLTVLACPTLRAQAQAQAPVQNTTPTSSDAQAPKTLDEQNAALKNEEKANKARAKADKAQRKALRAQEKAEKAAAKAATTTQTPK